MIQHTMTYNAEKTAVRAASQNAGSRVAALPASTPKLPSKQDMFGG